MNVMSIEEMREIRTKIYELINWLREMEEKILEVEGINREGFFGMPFIIMKENIEHIISKISFGQERGVPVLLIYLDEDIEIEHKVLNDTSEKMVKYESTNKEVKNDIGEGSSQSVGK